MHSSTLSSNSSELDGSAVRPSRAPPLFVAHRALKPALPPTEHDASTTYPPQRHTEKQTSEASTSREQLIEMSFGAAERALKALEYHAEISKLKAAAESPRLRPTRKQN